MTKSKVLFKVLTAIFEIALVMVFLYSLWHVIDYFVESKRESDFNEALIESVVSPISPEDAYDIKDPNNDNKDDSSGSLNGIDVEKIDLRAYPDIKVDLEKVKKEYPRAVGWLYCPNSPINYPVMQGTDNAYYVDRMPNGRRSGAGSIFMDYRDDADLTDFAHVLYGHNMKNNSMFGTILDYRNKGYFEEHPYMFYFTEDKTYRLEIFAGVNTIATSNLYLEPASDKRESFIANAFKKSTFKSDVSVSPEDKIFQMSTCSGATGQNKRYMIYAKLIEI